MTTKPILFQFKLILIGEKAVGKTSIRRNYMGLQFLTDYSSTIGTEFASKTTSLENTPFTFHYQIWDIAGQKIYSSLHNLFYTGTHAVLVVYDLTNKRTFQEVTSWLEDAFDGSPDTIRFVALIGNKKDIEPEPPLITDDEITELIQTISTRYKVPICAIKTSAKTGENITTLFELIGFGLLSEEEREQAINANPKIRDYNDQIFFLPKHDESTPLLKQDAEHSDYDSSQSLIAFIDASEADAEPNSSSQSLLSDLEKEFDSFKLLLETLNHQMDFISEKLNKLDKRMNEVNTTLEIQHSFLLELNQKVEELEKAATEKQKRSSHAKTSLSKDEINELLSQLDDED